MMLMQTYLPLVWVDTEPFPSSSSPLSSCPIPPLLSCFQMGLGFHLFKVGLTLSVLQPHPPLYWKCWDITIPESKA